MKVKAAKNGNIVKNGEYILIYRVVYNLFCKMNSPKGVERS